MEEKLKAVIELCEAGDPEMCAFLGKEFYYGRHRLHFRSWISSHLQLQEVSMIWAESFPEPKRMTR